MKYKLKNIILTRMPLLVRGKQGKLVNPFSSNHAVKVVTNHLTESLYKELSTNEDFLSDAIKEYVLHNGVENLYIEIRKFQEHGILTNLTVQLRIN